MNFRKIAIAALVSASAFAALTPSASAFHGGGHGGGFHGGGFHGGGFHGGGFHHHHGWGHGGWGYAGYYGGCLPRRFINAWGEVVVTNRCY